MPPSQTQRMSAKSPNGLTTCDARIANNTGSCDQIIMIERSQMFEPMLEAHPEFSELWDEFIKEWLSEPEGLPYYTLISDVVRECSKILATGQKHRIRKVLSVVERWLLEGDKYVREAATVGFLEDLQNGNLHEGTTPEDFVEFLGPECSFWWKKVERFFSHGEPILDDR